jgi:hypothetical protein
LRDEQSSAEGSSERRRSGQLSGQVMPSGFLPLVAGNVRDDDPVAL